MVSFASSEKQWISCLGATLTVSCLARSCPVLSGFCLFVAYNNFPTNVHFALCTDSMFTEETVQSKLQPVLLKLISIYGCDLFWGIQEKARRDKTIQCASLRQTDKTRRVPPGFEKCCTCHKCHSHNITFWPLRRATLRNVVWRGFVVAAT